MTDNKWYDTRAVIPFETPARLTIVASTNGGKTLFVKKLLENANGMFTNKFENIYYHYGSAYQPVFDEMLKCIPNLIFKPGIPLEDELAALFGEDNSKHNCLVIDDLMFEVNNNAKLEKLWTVHSHHYNLTLLYCTQNLFEKGKASRSISLNTSYFCLFQNYRDQLQIQHFGREAFAGKTNLFMQAFRLATHNPYGYLIVDLDNKSDKRFRLRTNIFPGENTIVYDLNTS